MNASSTLIFSLLFASAMGLGLGLFYFGGLWWSIHQVVSGRHSALFLLASFILRAVLVVGGFYLVSAGQFSRLAACLVGFLVARLVLIARMRFRPVSVERPGEASPGKELSI